MQVQTQLTNHVMAMLPAAVCGIVCGLAAIVFTIMNLKVARFRGEAIKSKRQRMAEPMVVMAVFVTLGMVLPLFFPCTPTQCVVLQGTMKPICPEGTPARIQ